MTRLIILRHGETLWNRDGRMQGRADVALNERGLQQAAAAAQALAGEQFDAVVSSPLQRAAVTARVVAEVHGLDVRLDERLAEVDVGSWSGRTREEIGREQDKLQGLYFKGEDYRRSETGETATEVGDRAVAAVEDLAKEYPDGSVLVVAHGFLTQMLVSRLIGLEGFGNRLGVLGNAHWTELRYDHDRWYLCAYNIGRHRRDDVVGTADSPAPRASYS